MSKEIDLSKPLSDFDRTYLEARDRHEDIRANFEQFGGKEPPEPNDPRTGPNSIKDALGPTALTPQQQAEYDAANAKEEADEPLDYEAMTVPELKAELDERAKESDSDEEKANLTYKANDSKATLIAKLEKDDELVSGAE